MRKAYCVRSHSRLLAFLTTVVFVRLMADAKKGRRRQTCGDGAGQTAKTRVMVAHRRYDGCLAVSGPLHLAPEPLALQ